MSQNKKRNGNRQEGERDSINEYVTQVMLWCYSQE